MIPFNPMGFAKSPAAAPPAGVTVGRSNSAAIAGSNTSCAVGWASGGAAANGTWLVAVCRNNTGNSYNITGGSAWTELGTSNIFYKQCGASEPTTYSCQYFGSKKDEAQAISIIEILGASSMEAGTSASATNTCPARTSTDAGDLAVIAGALAGFLVDLTIAPPSGYTLATKNDKSNAVGFYTSNANTILATKSSVGSGSISPGAFSCTTSSGHGTLDQVATLLFKP